MPDGHYVRCADCNVEYDANRCYHVHRPSNEVTPIEPSDFYLCVPCWDRMIGAAMLSLFR